MKVLLGYKMRNENTIMRSVVDVRPVSGPDLNELFQRMIAHADPKSIMMRLGALEFVLAPEQIKKLLAPPGQPSNNQPLPRPPVAGDKAESQQSPQPNDT